MSDARMLAGLCAQSLVTAAVGLVFIGIVVWALRRGGPPGPP